MQRRMFDIILVMACLFFAGLCYYQHGLLSNLERRPSYAIEDMPFIDRAKNLWIQSSKEDEASILRYRYPVVIYMGNEICVELRLESGSVGGSPVYCFDIRSSKITRAINNVE